MNKSAYAKKVKKASRSLARIRRQSSGPTARLKSFSPKSLAKAVELKGCDVPQFNLGFSSTAPSLALLNGLSVGNNFYQRVGRQVVLHSLRVKGYVVPTRGNAAAVNNQSARILVVYDRQPNGVLPNNQDIIQGIDSLGGTTFDADQHPNLNNRERFLILRDDFFMLMPLGINGANSANNYNYSVDPASNGSLHHIDWYIPLKGLKMQFGGDTNAISSIQTGALYLWTFSTGDTNATSAWAFFGSARLRYVD